MTPSAERRIGVLRLTAPSDALVRRGALLVEDALRVASIPGADGSAVIYVRRLSLGRIWPWDTSATLALRIEDQIRLASAGAVHASAADAAESAAVYFRDSLEPYVMLALAIASGRAPAAWYWKRAVSVWRPGMPAAAGLRAVFAALITRAREESGVEGMRLAAAQLLEVLITAGRADALSEILTEDDAPALLASFDWSRREALVPQAPVAVDGSSPVLRESVMMPAAWTLFLERWAARWGPADERTVWLAAVLLVAARPGLASSTRVMSMAAAQMLPHAKSAAPGHAGRPAVSAVQPTPEASPSVADSDAVLSVRRAPEPEWMPVPQEQQPTREPVPAETFAGSEKPVSELARVTSAAGLYFLIPMLLRMRFPEWLADRPELIPSEIAAALLLDVARRTGTPERDPAILSLTLLLTDSVEPHMPEPPPVVLGDWVRKLRRWSRRQARMGLHTLVRRPGRIAATRTHIDVMFRLEQADMRVRKAGLDIDPGWQPWLGKVVRFHYLSD